MHNHYIINDAVEFHPATGVLRDLNHPDQLVVLNSPAGRCLLLLIEREGNIVTQHEFLEYVWEQRGIHVAASTFYQNISILRKGLKKIGLTDEVVVTIPRIGLTLASSTHVKKITTEYQLALNHENAHLIDEHSITEEPNTYYQHISKKRANEFQIFKKPIYKIITTRLNRSLHLLFCFAFALFIITLTAFIFLNIENESDYFSNYKFLNTTNGCHIFLSNTIHTNVQNSNIMKRFKQLPYDCKNYPWVYVTHSPLLPGTSFIRCNKPMNEQNTCLSDYFLEGD